MGHSNILSKQISLIYLNTTTAKGSHFDPFLALFSMASFNPLTVLVKQQWGGGRRLFKETVPCCKRQCQNPSKLERATEVKQKKKKRGL